MKGEDEEDISEAEFLRRMSTAYKLPSQVRDLIPYVPALAAADNLVSGTLGRIEKALSTYFGGNVESMQKQLGDAMTSLEFISANLSTSQFSEPVLDDEFLERIRNEVNSVYSDIQHATDLPPSEQTHLLNLLDLIANAIVEVDIGGAERLRAAANEVAGTMLSEFPIAGASHWRNLVASLALGIAIEIGSGVVTGYVLPPVEEWVSHMPTFHQIESGESGPDADTEVAELLEVVDEQSE
jgi:hypothetical protein